LGLPGTHGATVFGTQGIGVSTPKAAAVADATVGFANEVHIANGGILTIGALSIMVAAGAVVSVFILDVTIRFEGAVPKEQSNPAPAQTQIPIYHPFLVITTVIPAPFCHSREGGNL
jgi:hypothetical protein